MVDLDSIGFNHLISELKEKLLSKKITKIEQYTKNNFNIYFGKIPLTFLIQNNFALMYISNTSKNISNITTPFLLTLKKFLIYSNLENIYQYKYDRIIVFKFSKINHLGEKVLYDIIFEIRGRNSDIILVDDKSKILATLNSNRNIEYKNFIGGIYVYNDINSILPNEVDEIELESNFKNTIGLSKQVLKYKFKDLNEYRNYILELSPVIYYKNDKKILTYTRYFLKDEKYNSYISLNDAINEYLETFETTNDFNNIKNTYISKINKLIDKEIKIIEKINKDLEKRKDYEKYKLQAELILAYAYMYKDKYLEKINVNNYYNNEEIEIFLDNKYTVIENSNILYKKYNKLKNSIILMENRKDEIKEKIDYLKENLYFLNKATEIEILDDILIELNLIKEKIIKKQKLKKREILKIEYNNSTIYIGRNSVENNEVTFKIAENNDLWFHIKDYAGSHIIAKNHDMKEDVINYCAKLAKEYSSASIESKVVIDYTLKKNVKKIKGSSLGNVTYTNQKSVIIK